MEVNADSGKYLNFELITSEQGISHRSITSITRDQYGYMWFGTTIGLNKYDGINFNIYNSNDSVLNCISDSRILALYNTRDGQLWIGTPSGLNVFNRATNNFTVFLHDPANKYSLSSNYIRSIYEDSHGTLWIGTSEGLDALNRDTGNFNVFLHDDDNPNSISNNNISAIYEDRLGRLWIGTENGLNRLDTKTMTFKKYMYDPNNTNSISNNYITAICEDSQGQLWIGTQNGLSRLNMETMSFSNYTHNSNPNSISNNNITYICGDNQGDLWIGTQVGLNRLDTTTASFTTYLNEPANRQSINNNYICSIYFSTDDNILWIGTQNGVNILNFNKQIFKSYSSIFDGNSITGIKKCNEDTLWLQTRMDLIKYNIEQNSIEKVWADVFNEQQYSLLLTTLFSVFTVGLDGNIWIATTNSGLKRLDPATNNIVYYRNDPNDNKSIRSNDITALCVSHDGIIWVGTKEGLCSLDPDKETFTSYDNSIEYPKDISEGLIQLIYETPDNNLCFASESGIYIYDENHKLLKILNYSDFLSPSNEKITLTLYEDNDKQLWIGTFEGLFCYDLKDMSFIQNQVANIFRDEAILGIIQDDNGNIWISTRAGLWGVSIKNNVYKEYTISDGLENDAFRLNSHYKADNGELYFGCMIGMTSFYPDEIIKNNNTSKVVINNFSLLDKPLKFSTPIEDVHKIILPYKDNSFIIDFVLLHYYAPKSYRYAYRLEGFDMDWSYCDASASFTKYTNIPAGEYTFIVKALNSDGVWNEATSLDITINKPYWQTWWFILSIIALSLLLLLLIIKLRTLSTNNYAQKLEDQVEERTHELTQKLQHLEKEIKLHKMTEKKLEEEIDNRIKYTRALVHELKTPLNPLIAASDFLLSNIETEPLHSFAKSINSSAVNLSYKIDNLLDLARGELGILKLEYHYIDPRKLITEVYEYVKPEALKNEQTLMMEIPKHLSIIQCDEERIKQAIFNLLNNAFKFTPKGGNILIRAKNINGGIIISVKDNGCGIDRKEKQNLFKPYKRLEGDKAKLSGLGIGLSLVKQTIDLHGGQIWVTSHKDKGSIFSFYLPVKPNTDQQKTEKEG
jgi:signal transduction histidine kinase/ligand-binding sensor domain-containing protein